MDTLVEIKNLDTFDKAMVAAMADGKITKEEDANAQKLIGAKVTVSNTVTTQNEIKVNTFSTTTTIGKADINVTIKTAQSIKDTNIVSTGPANTKITTHYNAYFIHDSSVTAFNAGEKVEEARLVQKYGKDNVLIIGADNKNRFNEVWNSMDNNNANIDEVSFLFHANPNFLAIGKTDCKRPCKCQRFRPRKCRDFGHKVRKNGHGSKGFKNTLAYAI